MCSLLDAGARWRFSREEDEEVRKRKLERIPILKVSAKSMERKEIRKALVNLGCEIEVRILVVCAKRWSPDGSAPRSEGSGQ